MKRKKDFHLRAADGTAVPVTEEVYRTYYRMRRNERYQDERKREKREINAASSGYAIEHIAHFASAERIAEQREACRTAERILREEWEALPERDRRMMRLLYFKKKTLKETAGILGCSRSSVVKRRNRILSKIRQRLKAEGINGTYEFERR